MSRQLIVRLFFGSLIGIGVALVLLLAALTVAIATGSLAMADGEVVGIRPGIGWAMIALGAVAVIVLLGAALAQLVAWIGALIESAGFENKAWFVVLLVTGLLGLALIPMLVYVLIPPEPTRSPASIAPAPSELTPR
jgi:hypothetical protein